MPPASRWPRYPAAAGLAFLRRIAPGSLAWRWCCSCCCGCCRATRRTRCSRSARRPEQIAAARAAGRHPTSRCREQFATGSGSSSRFDLGNSFISALPVGPEIAARLVVTVPLTLLAFVPRRAGRGAGRHHRRVQSRPLVRRGCSRRSRSSASRCRCSGSASCSSRSSPCTLGCSPPAASRRTAGATPADALRVPGPAGHDDRARDERVADPLRALAPPSTCSAATTCAPRGPAAPRFGRRCCATACATPPCR